MSYNLLTNASRTTSLLGVWRCGETSGSIIADTSGNGNDGTLVGTINTGEGPTSWLSSSVLLSISDYIDLPLSSLSGDNATCLIWIKVNNDPSSLANSTGIGVLGGNMIQANHHPWTDGVIYNGFWRSSGGSSNRVTCGNPTADLEDWHLLCVKTSPTEGWALNLDTVPQATATGVTSLDTSGSAWWVGRSRQASGSQDFWLDGYVADIAIYDGYLSDADELDFSLGPEPVFSITPTAPTGTPEEGQTLTRNTGTAQITGGGTNGTVTYQQTWFRCDDLIGTNDVEIAGQTGSTYTLAAADVGKFIRTKSAAYNDGGNDSDADTFSGHTSVVTSSEVASTYYVRNDGTASKSLSTDSSSASSSMSLSTFNSETFIPGDEIVFSNKGGDFVLQTTIPSSGTSGSPIAYRGEPDYLPNFTAQVNCGSTGLTISDVTLRDLISTSTGTTGFNFGGSGTGIETFNLSQDGIGNQCLQHLDTVSVTHNNLTLSSAGDEGISCHDSPTVIVNGATIADCTSGLNWVGTPDLTVNDAIISGAGTGSSSGSIKPAHVGSCNITFRRCVVIENPNHADRVIDFGAIPADILIENCIFLNLTDGDFYMLARNGVSSFKVVNCTFVGSGTNNCTAIFNQDADFQSINNCFLDCGTQALWSNTGTIDSNSFYNSGTVRGTNAVASDPLLDSLGMIDSIESPLIGAGVGPESNGDVPDHDIDGDQRSGTATDIGADVLYVPPTFDASSSHVLSHARHESSAIAYSPERNLTVDAHTSPIGQVSAASFELPSFDGLIVAELPASLSEIAALHLSPTFESEVQVSVSPAIGAMSTTFATVVSTGSLPGQTGPSSAFVIATSSLPIYEASVDSIVPSPNVESEANFDAPVYEGTSSATTGTAEGSVAAIFASEIYAGSASLVVGASNTNALATFVTGPVYADIDVLIGASIASASSLFSGPQYSASLNVTLGGSQIYVYDSSGSLVLLYYQIMLGA